MQWGEWRKIKESKPERENKVNLQWLFYLTRRKMKAPKFQGRWGWLVIMQSQSELIYWLKSSLKFQPVCLGVASTPTISFQSGHQEGGLGRWITCNSWGWTWDKRLPPWRSGSRAPRTQESVYWQGTFAWVQLTYFKNRSIKRISKFSLWIYLELKIPLRL